MALPVVATVIADRAAMPMMLPPVILPVADIVPGVVRLPAAKPAVMFNAPITLPVRLKFVAVIKEDFTVPTAERLPPITLPVTVAVVPITLPPVMFAEVVMLVAEFNADITLPLRLNPTAFKLPPMTLPMAVTLFVALTLVAVNVPITAPTADTLPNALRYTPVTLPTELTLWYATTLLAMMLPVPPLTLATSKLSSVPTVLKLLNNTLELNVLPNISAALEFTEMPVIKLPLPTR